MIRSRLSSAWGLLTGKLNALTIRWLQGAPPGPTNSQVQAAAARAFLLQEYGVLRFDPVSCIDHVPGDPHFESLEENLETLMDFASRELCISQCRGSAVNSRCTACSSERASGP
jgi:hypothetical protein